MENLFLLFQLFFCSSIRLLYKNDRQEIYIKWRNRSSAGSNLKSVIINVAH